MANDPRDPRNDGAATPTNDQRRQYEPPRLERKRSVARVTLSSHGSGATSTSTAFARRHP
jgi:hypothetical protein